VGTRIAAIAELLARHRTMILGVVVPDLLNPVFFQLLVQVELAADAAFDAVLPALGEMAPAHEQRPSTGSGDTEWTASSL
jgi:DNA-binding LacI/PurR family transcriptional regulator